MQPIPESWKADAAAHSRTPEHPAAPSLLRRYGGDLGQPNLFVPLPAAIAQRKIDLILRHYQSLSRRSRFRSETLRAVLGLRGIECNAADGLAEAFHCRKATI